MNKDIVPCMKSTQSFEVGEDDVCDFCHQNPFKNPHLFVKPEFVYTLEALTCKRNEQHQLILHYVMWFNLMYLNTSSCIWGTMFPLEGNNCLRLLLSRHAVLARQPVSCKYCKILVNIYTIPANAILLFILTIKSYLFNLPCCMK